MNDLERALRDAEIPDGAHARERARRTVLAAHAQAAPRRRRGRAAAVWATVAAAAAALAATQLSPAQALEGFWDRVVAKPTATATPVPNELPARGRLLVTEGDALWLVERSGKRRRLGAWEDATWSPKGLFIGVSSGHTLAAVEPDSGDLRWRLTLPGPVSSPRWAPDGMHVAYRAGRTLRIVYGNGEHDVRAGDNMAPVAPAWRPSDLHSVAWASRDGVVTVEDADTAKVLWTFPAASVTRLAWSGDGRELLVGSRRSYAVHNVITGARRVVRARLAGAAFSRSRLAVAVYDGTRTSVRVDGSEVLSAPGRLRDLVWSPDGRWLLAGWPGADHWLVVRGAAVSAVRQRLGDSAVVRGWCC